VEAGQKVVYAVKTSVVYTTVPFSQAETVAARAAMAATAENCILTVVWYYLLLK